MAKQSGIFAMVEMWYDSTTYHYKIGLQKKNDEHYLGDMGIGAVKKHTKTEWSQSKYEPVLVNIDLFPTQK